MEIGDKVTLGGTEGFTYVGMDDYGTPGWDHHLFACLIEGQSHPAFLLDDYWIFPIKKEEIIIEGQNVSSKSGKFPQHRLTSGSEDYRRIAGLVHRNLN